MLTGMFANETSVIELLFSCLGLTSPGPIYLHIVSGDFAYIEGYIPRIPYMYVGRSAYIQISAGRQREECGVRASKAIFLSHLCADILRC